MDDCTGTAEVIAGVGVYIVEHSGTFVSTGVEVNGELCAFDLAADRNCTGFVDQLIRVVSRNFNNLGIPVDALVDDHKTACCSTVFKAGSGIHGDVDHTLFDLFVEALHDLVDVRFIPAADHSAIVIHDAGAGVVRCGFGLISFAAAETTEWQSSAGRR